MYYLVIYVLSSNRSITVVFTLFISLIVLLFTLSAANADVLELDLKSKEKLTKFSQNISLSVKSNISKSPEQAALGLLDASIDYLMPGIGKNAPDWMKRIELEWQIRENFASEYAITTVQPLWESNDFQDTIFTQLSLRRYELFGRDRDVANIGLGYRRLIFNDTVLMGANNFYDYEFDLNHQRTSLGFEAKWAGLDFSTNKYWGLSNGHTDDQKLGVEEEPLDGHDIELTSQVPYLPWAKVTGRRYWWKTKTASEDIKGWEASINMDLLQNLQIEAGVNSDNFIKDNNNNEVYIMSRFHFNFNRPITASSQVISTDPWLMRDMKDFRLDKVKRENKIIVERRASGISIARGT
jgi:adhesin/invasin